ncbi:unnamed protein product [Adineta steineri]|uniref:Uncharacterized protein n=1 Tax=Adineta steineri TaxID=433720 RepID=A0A816E8N4_9BILA|nr:unnamed protein product [Adineta steineri]CAF1645690.1 unnamed protein product [Adineta steineri]
MFLKRVQRNQFDFHQLPFKSLLKLSGKNFKVIQYPNEILILSGGILSQSFIQDEILCESIHFALSSCLSDQFPKNSSLCHCKLFSNLNKDESIDMNLYNDETIQGYIQKCLHLNIHQNKNFFIYLDKDSKLDKDLSLLDNINEQVPFERLMQRNKLNI